MTPAAATVLTTCVALLHAHLFYLFVREFATEVWRHGHRIIHQAAKRTVVAPRKLLQEQTPPGGPLPRGAISGQKNADTKAPGRRLAVGRAVLNVRSTRMSPVGSPSYHLLLLFLQFHE